MWLWHKRQSERVIPSPHTHTHKTKTSLAHPARCSWPGELKVTRVPEVSNRTDKSERRSRRQQTEDRGLGDENGASTGLGAGVGDPHSPPWRCGRQQPGGEQPCKTSSCLRGHPPKNWEEITNDEASLDWPPAGLHSKRGTTKRLWEQESAWKEIRYENLWLWRDVGVGEW